jgi:AAA+ superfamily predicted ATPase
LCKYRDAYRILLKIGSCLDRAATDAPEPSAVAKGTNPRELENLIALFGSYSRSVGLHLDREEILLTATAFHRHVMERGMEMDPLELIAAVFPDPASRLAKLDLIISLLKKQVFFTARKRVLEHRRWDGSPAHQVKYSRYGILESDIRLHRAFLQKLLGEFDDVERNDRRPYRTNTEFLSDWFSYLDQLREFSLWDFTERRYDSELEAGVAEDLLKAVQWRERIAGRLKASKKDFPLLDLIDEYRLDHNEVVILMYLVKADIEGDDTTDLEDVIKIISRDRHEMYRNRAYLAVESKLVRYGLVELSDQVFFRSRGCSIRVAPDITHRIIDKSPVTDDEKMAQILRGDDLFTLLEPRQSLDQLILPAKVKKIIATAITRYRRNVDRVLSEWGLFSGEMETIGKPRKKTEPGLLMLFYGLPGTGKTFAAGAVAQALGKKLLVTDISRIQSKWVGESEKNVRRLFTLFERIVRRTENPPVLLLNEADQFLSRRIGTMDTAVDVMYNSLQNLFLEAFERLRGVMIATTNLHENLDRAFSRRFHIKLEFPLPGVAERYALWKLHLPETIPGADEIDVQSLAATYGLTGGQIRLIVENAATEAASRRRKTRRITMPDLIKYCEIEIHNMFDRKASKLGFQL